MRFDSLGSEAHRGEFGCAGAAALMVFASCWLLVDGLHCSFPFTVGRFPALMQFLLSRRLLLRRE